MRIFKNINKFTKKVDKKLALRAIAAATVLTFTLSFCDFSAKCDSIADNVLRLHILANSDSQEDQALKLKVRDAVLEISSEVFYGCENESQAIAKAQSKMDYIVETAQKTIYENGFNYGVSVEIADTWFEVREYDDFTLPAGYYKAIRILIGEGKGKNWWCVMFPAVCIPVATERSDISDILTENESKIVKQPGRYVARFKTVELFQKAGRKLTTLFN